MLRKRILKITGVFVLSICLIGTGILFLDNSDSRAAENFSVAADTVKISETVEVQKVEADIAAAEEFEAPVAVEAQYDVLEAEEAYAEQADVPTVTEENIESKEIATEAETEETEADYSDTVLESYEATLPEPIKGVVLTDEQTKILAAENREQHGALALEVADLVNSYRAENGLAPLAYDDSLVTVAMHRSTENAWVDCFDVQVVDGRSHHIRPNGQKASSVFTVYGMYGSYAENMGRYQTSPSEVVLGEYGWKYSEAHNALMLNETYTRIGVGVAVNADGDYYWTAVFSR